MYKYFVIFMIVICFILTIVSFLPFFGSPDYNKTPIIFVHGYGSYASCWDSMIKFLKRSGYPREYLLSIQLNPNTGSNIKAAKQISGAVEEHLAKTNELLKKRYPSLALKNKIDLLSKSMGALSSRWYTARLRPDRIRVWLSFGGAHHGTNALCQWGDQGAKDCCPVYASNLKESPIQYMLNGKPYLGDIDETPYGLGKDSYNVESIFPDNERRILYISIRTYPDRWIKPERSAILDGTGGLRLPFPKDTNGVETSPGNILMTNGVTHDGMISDRATMRLVKIILGVFDR